MNGNNIANSRGDNIRVLYSTETVAIHEGDTNQRETGIAKVFEKSI